MRRGFLAAGCCPCCGSAAADAEAPAAPAAGAAGMGSGWMRLRPAAAAGAAAAGAAPSGCCRAVLAGSAAAAAPAASTAPGLAALGVAAAFAALGAAAARGAGAAIATGSAIRCAAATRLAMWAGSWSAGRGLPSSPASKAAMLQAGGRAGYQICRLNQTGRQHSNSHHATCIHGCAVQRATQTGNASRLWPSQGPPAGRPPAVAVARGDGQKLAVAGPGQVCDGVVV